MKLIRWFRRILLKLLFGFDASKLSIFSEELDKTNKRLEEIENLMLQLSKAMRKQVEESNPHNTVILNGAISDVSTRVSELTDIVHNHQMLLTTFLEGDEAAYLQLALSVVTDNEHKLN